MEIGTGKSRPQPPTPEASAGRHSPPKADGGGFGQSVVTSLHSVALSLCPYVLCHFVTLSPSHPEKA